MINGLTDWEISALTDKLTARAAKYDVMFGPYETPNKVKTEYIDKIKEMVDEA